MAEGHEPSYGIYVFQQSLNSCKIVSKGKTYRVYKKKRGANGKVKTYQAWLIAKGYT